MRERLIELINKSFAEESEKRLVITAQYTADYLLDNGVIVLPCKVGDMVYDLTFGEVNTYIVEKMNFTYTPDGLECEEVIAMGKYGLHFNFDNIGKTVFLTKEEALEALKGAEGK